jgi:hypothetical protein
LVIEKALAALYDAYDDRADRVQRLVDAQRGLDEMLANGSADDGKLATLHAELKAASHGIAQAADRLRGVLLSEPREAPNGDINASQGRLRLNELPRAVLLPRVRAPKPPPRNDLPPAPAMPKATSFEELERAGDAIRAVVKQRLEAAASSEERAVSTEPVEDLFALPLSARNFARRWARECFDEVAMLGMLRLPLLGDDWRAIEASEQRMLNNVDALLTFGQPALEFLEELALDAPVRDPWRTFAVALIGGSVRGRDALGMTERVLRDSVEDPASVTAFVSAMKLAPHPDLQTLLRELLCDDDPSLRAGAAEVLTHRGWADPELLDTLMSDRPEVAAHAVMPMTLSKHPNTERAIDEAVQSPYPLHRQRGWEALAVSNHHERLRAILRKALTSPYGDTAARLLGVFGSHDDVEALRERALAEPGQAYCDALGFAGWPDTVPDLIAVLDAEEPHTQIAAARALERITGAGLLDDVEIAPEATIERELPEPDVGDAAVPPPTPLAQLVSDPRMQPSAGSPDTMELPTTDPEAWKRCWAEYGANFDVATRYRRGFPLSPVTSLAEIDGPMATAAERWLAQLELAASTKRWVPLATDDLVTVQEESIAAWSTLVGSR